MTLSGTAEDDPRSADPEENDLPLATVAEPA